MPKVLDIKKQIDGIFVVVVCGKKGIHAGHCCKESMLLSVHEPVKDQIGKLGIMVSDICDNKKKLFSKVDSMKKEYVGKGINLEATRKMLADKLKKKWDARNKSQ